MNITVNVNGVDVTRDINPELPLLWFLRDELRLTGTKFGCGIAQCGACTVLVDGAPTRSCVMPVEFIDGSAVETIEALQGSEHAAIQDAWLSIDVPQCGYCQSGQIVSATALLRENRRPSDEDIDDAMSGNLCRCATYNRIRSAIRNASENLEG